MSDEHTIRARTTLEGGLVQVLPDGSTRPLPGMTEAEWARFDALTDEEVYQAALSDPDNPPRTAEELARMRRVPNVEKLRLGMNLTQEEFARQFEISLSTLREWERGARHLDRTAISYLAVIENNPDAVRQALRPEGHAPDSESDERSHPVGNSSRDVRWFMRGVLSAMQHATRRATVRQALRPEGNESSERDETRGARTA